MTLLDVLQTAPAGTPALDGLIQLVLTNPAVGDGGTKGPVPTARWSEDLTSLVRLVPSDHNFSLGERDGVVWAWIQPNDGWVPGANEMRHDHPRGSGLVVASTLSLAMAAALIALRTSCAYGDGATMSDAPGAV